MISSCYPKFKVGDRCFHIWNEHNPNVKTSIIIYNVCKLVDYDFIKCNITDTTSGKLPTDYFNKVRPVSEYTKCNSTTIEELRNEFPEIFI